MITPSLLLEIALNSEALAKLHAEDGYEHRRQARNALECACEMERRGIAQTTHFGPFGWLPSKGDRVRIKAGARIYSTSERLRRDLGRSYVVTVHDCYNGCVSTNPDNGMPEIRQPQVHWVGAGGYWCWTDIQNIEIVS